VLVPNDIYDLTRRNAGYSADSQTLRGSIQHDTGYSLNKCTALDDYAGRSLNQRAFQVPSFFKRGCGHVVPSNVATARRIIPEGL